MLELENLRTNETIQIEPEGQTFGRAGSSADITLRDQAVSKRHARIYEEGGLWYLEDLGSSNGTYVDRQKITERVQLSEGMVFAMSRFKFRVNSIGGAGGGAAVGGADPMFDTGADEIAPPGDPSPPPPAADIAPPPAAAEPPPPAAPAAAMSQDVAATSPPTGAEDMPDEPDDFDASKGAAYLIAAVPKAFGYYMISVPYLAMAPWKAIPASIDEQKHEAKGKFELMAYALPAFAGSALIGSLCGAIATAIGGGGFGAAIGAAIGGIIAGAIGGLIGSLIVGLFGDRVLAWFINLLKGESDARSRTNYFLLVFTSTLLVAVPNGLGAIFGAIPLPVLPGLGPLLQLVGTAISLFVFYKWFVFFRVVKWFQIVILVLGGLALLGTLASVVTVTIASFSSSPSTPDVPDTDDDDEEKDDEEKDDEEKDDEEKADDEEKKDDEEKADDEEKKDDEEKADDEEKKDDPPPKKEKKKKKKDKKKKKAKVEEPDDSADDVAMASGSIELPSGSKPTVDYADFADMIKDIDEALTENPLLLDQVKGARNLYEEISAARYEADKQFRGAMSKNPQHELVHTRDRDAYVYLKVSNEVAKLHALVD